MKRAVCLIGALVAGLGFSQVPEYAQQYSQRLGGAVDELGTIIAQFDADAEGFGLTRDEGLERYAQSPDDFLAARGISMQAVFARYERLSAQLAQLRTAGPVERLGVLAQGFDTDVGAAAWRDYEPAVPVTPEGLLHALVGLLAGYGLVWGGWTATAAPFRRRRKAQRIEPRF